MVLLTALCSCLCRVCFLSVVEIRVLKPEIVLASETELGHCTPLVHVLSLS